MREGRFARVEDPVRDKMRLAGVEKAIGADGFFETIGGGVAAFAKRKGVSIA